MVAIPQIVANTIVSKSTMKVVWINIIFPKIENYDDLRNLALSCKTMWQLFVEYGRTTGYNCKPGKVASWRGKHIFVAPKGKCFVLHKSAKQFYYYGNDFLKNLVPRFVADNVTLGVKSECYIISHTESPYVLHNGTKTGEYILIWTDLTTPILLPSLEVATGIVSEFAEAQKMLHKFDKEIRI